MCSQAASIQARSATAAVLAFLLVGAELRAQPDGRVTGIVQDLAGNPMPGVRATVTGPAGLEATTNRAGQAVFDRVPEGDYRSRLSGTLGIRYSRDRKTIENPGGSSVGDTVLSGEPRQLDVQLSVTR